MNTSDLFAERSVKMKWKKQTQLVNPPSRHCNVNYPLSSLSLRHLKLKISFQAHLPTWQTWHRIWIDFSGSVAERCWVLHRRNRLFTIPSTFLTSPNINLPSLDRFDFTGVTRSCQYWKKRKAPEIERINKCQVKSEGRKGKLYLIQKAPSSII